MIAANFRRYPEALAVQLCLDFGAVVRWATSRPGSRILRSIRAARAAAIRLLPFVPPWTPPICIEPPSAVPEWLVAARRRARELAKSVRSACIPAFTEHLGYTPRPSGRGRPLRCIVFTYAA